MKGFGVAALSVSTVVFMTAIFMAWPSRPDASPLSGRSASDRQVYSVLSNGQSIFDTGRDLNGVRITAEPSPLGSSCEACHMAGGQGGRHFSDGAVSADLRHRALVTEQTHPYTLVLLERAISTGIDNEGKALDHVMPHWRMSKRDLHDVAQYVLVKVR